MDQVKYVEDNLQNISSESRPYHLKFLKAVHKFCLVHSWIFDPNHCLWLCESSNPGF